MQQQREQAGEYRFGFENGFLDFSCLKIEINLTQRVYEGSFTIYSLPGRYTEGYITSSDIRMECLTQEFSGTNAEISFRFHGEDMVEGEVVKGEFYIVSNQGEYYLPFVFYVDLLFVDSSIGPIKNLFHFANLAKSNFNEAVNVFYHPAFEKVFKGCDMAFYEAYKGLAVRHLNQQAVEEFLITIQKKDVLEYLIEEKEIYLDNPIGVAEEILTIVRNGWGYTKLEIITEGDFLYIEKQILTDDDFLGNICRLPVYIDSQMLRPGKNLGQIILSFAYGKQQIPVTVMGGIGSKRDVTSKEERQLQVKLMEQYVSFRLKKIGTQTWITETEKIIDRLLILDDENIPVRLFQAQLFLTKERYKEAGWLLDHGLKLMEQQDKDWGELRAYYLYLTTLLNRDAAYITQVAKEVELIYREDRKRYRVAWLLLYLSEDYNRNMSHRWLFLERQIEYGCSSPLIYVEAMLLLQNNPSMLRKLGNFELQVLLFGAKNDVLLPALMEQLLYLSGRVREYNSLLFKILEICYKKEQDSRVLHEICALLIKGGKVSEDVLHWYRLGVLKELRITKLYEYYMASINLESTEEIPKLVLMYFAYQSNLDYEHSAFLYAYIMRKQEELQELYISYEQRIERFVVEQIQKMHINRHLAFLYEKLLTKGMIGEQTAPALAVLLFANRIRLSKENIRNVIVRRKGCVWEESYAVNGDNFWIPIYGNDSTVLLEDINGNRFIKGAEFTLEKLMIPGKFIRYVSPYVFDDFHFNLYLCSSIKAGVSLTKEESQRILLLDSDVNTCGNLKQVYTSLLLQYYYEEDDMRGLDQYLSRLRPELLNEAERGEGFKYLVLRGNYNKAYDWISYYGPAFFDTKSLVKLLSVKMEQTDFVEDRILLAGAVHVFRKGKYDGNILRYLILYFQGLMKEMRDIYKAAREFLVDYYELIERMLLQMLYTGAFIGEKMEVFRDYVGKGAKKQVETDFLIWCAHDYFARDEVTDEFVFEEIGKTYIRDGKIHKVCKLAFLKYYGENPLSPNDEIKEILVRFLQDMLEEGIHLKWFTELPGCSAYLKPMIDKTIIEYHTLSEAQVQIHYVITKEEGEASSYQEEDMKRVYAGVYYKEFVLFSGETLQYYIMENTGTQEELTQSGTVMKDENQILGEESRFHFINEMAISRNIEDYEKLNQQLHTYYKKDFLTRELFQIR
ncbi:DUF5717 family protein [Lachnospiraceae bacterium OttesenSCG-928-D06]|nr:DUF5717 family protein [Lachnospiraceae bacterium OttesenSCG-928-D06]